MAKFRKALLVLIPLGLALVALAVAGGAPFCPVLGCY